MALAIRVLPVPGGPYSNTPLGTRAPSFLNRLGSRRNSTISSSSSRASSAPATSCQRTEWPVGGLVFVRFVGGHPPPHLVRKEDEGDEAGRQHQRPEQQ